MNRKYYEKVRILLVFVGCFVCLLVFAFVKFEHQFMELEMSQKQEELEKTAKIKAESVRRKHENMMRFLQGMGESVKGMGDADREEIGERLALMAKVGYFDQVGISNAQGNALDSDQNLINIRERKYYRDAVNGNISVSDVIHSQVNEGEEIQIMSVPVKRGNSVVGVVFGIMKVGNMDLFLENETGSNIYTQIVDSKGDYITRAKIKDSLVRNTNVWDDFAEFGFMDRTIESMQEDMREGRSNSLKFRKGEEERFSFYMPLGIKGYYIFSTVNSEYLKNRTKKIYHEIYHMMSLVGVAFLFLLSGLVWFNRLVKKELQDSHAEAVSSAELMRIAIKESEQLVFEYDEKTKKLWKKAGVTNALFGDKVILNVPDSVIARGVIAEDSVKDFREIFEQTSKEETVEKLIQYRDAGGVQWFQILRRNIYDNRQQVLKAVGIVEDVTESVLQQEMLEKGEKEKAVLQNRAERDGLTGFYNATTIKIKVQEFLASPAGKNGIHQFLLMDLDNFKNINDTFGHQFGDRVLKETADILRKGFRHNDILGRLGGDEFIILLTDAADIKAMEHVFKEMCQKLKRTYTRGGKSVTVSASFGITEAPRFGATFHELYEKSDQMLYDVKRKTKNGYKAYEK